MLNNFNHYLHFGKTISKCLKQQSSDTISENQQIYKCIQMTSYVGYGAWHENNFFSKCYSYHVKQIFLKTKFQGLKRPLSGKISGKRQNDVSK